MDSPDHLCKAFRCLCVGVPWIALRDEICVTNHRVMVLLTNVFVEPGSFRTIPLSSRRETPWSTVAGSIIAATTPLGTKSREEGPARAIPCLSAHDVVATFLYYHTVSVHLSGAGIQQSILFCNEITLGSEEAYRVTQFDLSLKLRNISSLDMSTLSE